MTKKINFKSSLTFEERVEKSLEIIIKYPDRIPVICEKSDKKSNDICSIDKIKYIVPNDLTCAQFAFIIRNKLKLPSSRAIFLFVNNTMPSNSELISVLYNKYKDKDGFLYLSYSGENTFGKK